MMALNRRLLEALMPHATAQIVADHIEKLERAIDELRGDKVITTKMQIGSVPTEPAVPVGLTWAWHNPKTDPIPINVDLLVFVQSKDPRPPAVYAYTARYTQAPVPNDDDSIVAWAYLADVPPIPWRKEKS